MNLTLESLSAPTLNLPFHLPGLSFVIKSDLEQTHLRPIIQDSKKMQKSHFISQKRTLAKKWVCLSLITLFSEFSQKMIFEMLTFKGLEQCFPTGVPRRSR